VVVVEGATDRMAFDSEDGYSDDGTLEILARLYVRGLVTDLITAPKRGGRWRDKIEMRQETVKTLRSQSKRGDPPVDWLHVIDADEFYMPEDLTKMRDILKTTDKPAFSFPLFHFWGDLDHVAIGDQWDKPLPRMFRLTEDFEYLTRHDLPEGMTDGVPIPDIKIRHTGWLDTPRKINGKLRYYREREGGIAAATVVPFTGSIPPILQDFDTTGLVSPA